MSGESNPYQDNIFSDDLSSQDGPIPLNFFENYKQQTIGPEKTFEEYSDYILVFNSEVAKSFAGSAGLDKSSEAYSKYLIDSSSDALSKIIKMITSAGLKVELADFGKMRIALFISCPISRIKQEYISSKIHDYLHGVRVPDIEKLTSKQPKEELLDNIVISTAERLRLVHDILTNSVETGGAGISESKSPYIECLYPVHDRVFNQAWLKRIYSKWRVDYDDLTLARNHFGEELAYYFAFIDFYFAWLFIPAVFGLVFNFFFDVGSTINGTFTLVWATIFLELWSRRQIDLAAKWEVTNASKVEKVRPEFKESHIIRDPVTNELKPVASFWTSQLKKFVSLPIIFLFGCILCSLIILSFIVEIMFVDYYSGPYEEYLSVLPSIISMVSINSFSTLYFALAKKLTAFENHRTESQHDYYFSQKIFMVNFLLSYLSIFFISWVYIPYCDEITEVVKYFLPLKEEIPKVDLLRLQAQIFCYVVTSQGVNLVKETLLPILMRYAGRGARNATERARTQISKLQDEVDDSLEPLNPVTTAQTSLYRELKKFEHEYLELQPYTTYEDYAEMTIQFGYIVLFSVVFPLASVAGFLNNWLELRSDSVKIILSHRRLVPRRVENIGPWLRNMEILVWLGSIVNGLLIFQFNKSQIDLGSYQLLAGILFAILWEHDWFLFSSVVKSISSNIPTFGEEVALRETFQLKTKLIGKYGFFDEPGSNPLDETTIDDKLSGAIYQDADTILHKIFKV